MASLRAAITDVILILGSSRSSSSFFIVRYADGRFRVSPVSNACAFSLLRLSEAKVHRASPGSLTEFLGGSGWALFWRRRRPAAGGLPLRAHAEPVRTPGLPADWAQCCEAVN
jgi:hypothetical protein